MPERHQVLMPVSVVYICDECEQGKMEYTGKGKQKNGMFAHKCLNCGHVAWFGKGVYYPRLKYEPAEPVLFGSGTKQACLPEDRG